MTQTVDSSLTYDDFIGPTLCPDRWRVLELERGAGPTWRCEEPRARTEVGEGTLDMHVRRFTRAHDRIQAFDDLKHQLLSTQVFENSGRGRVTYSVEVAATHIGQTDYDWRDGQATFTVFDPGTGWSFRACTTSRHVFAIHEPIQVCSTTAFGCVKRASSLVTVPPGVSHRHQVTLNFDDRTLEWKVDSDFTITISDGELPHRVQLALGLATHRDVQDHGSDSLRAQGLSASFGPVRISSL